MNRLFVAVIVLLIFVSSGLRNSLLGQTEKPTAEEKVFSGPQPGEPLPNFMVRAVLGETAGNDQDWIAEANQAPLVLVFVHQINRQSISFVRTLTNYTSKRRDSGLRTGVVFLDADVSAAEEQVKRIQHALTPGVPTAVSADGIEGPGNYGLNRQVMLTVLVGEKQRVTANYALIQPSVTADLPKVLESIVSLVGGQVPTPEELNAGRPMADMPQPGTVDPAIMRPLLAPVIRRDASDEDVVLAAKKVEERAAEDPAIRREVARIANTIIKAGKLENYGTAKAQEFLSKWAKEFSDEQSDKTPPKNGDDKLTAGTDLTNPAASD